MSPPATTAIQLSLSLRLNTYNAKWSQPDLCDILTSMMSVMKSGPSIRHNDFSACSFFGLPADVKNCTPYLSHLQRTLTLSVHLSHLQRNLTLSVHLSHLQRNLTLSVHLSHLQRNLTIRVHRSHICREILHLQQILQERNAIWIHMGVLCLFTTERENVEVFMGSQDNQIRAKDHPGSLLYVVVDLASSVDWTAVGQHSGLVSTLNIETNKSIGHTGPQYGGTIEHFGDCWVCSTSCTLRTLRSWQKYCLNHCARTCCSLRNVTRCRFMNWRIRCEQGGRNVHFLSINLISFRRSRGIVLVKLRVFRSRPNPHRHRQRHWQSASSLVRCLWLARLVSVWKAPPSDVTAWSE